MNEIINGPGFVYILLIIAALGWGFVLSLGAMGKQRDSWHAEIWAREHPHRDGREDV